MQFQVPQFIETEPKIVGPLTLLQFFYIGGAAVISFASFFFFTFTLWAMITVVVAALGGSLAFIKVNGQPMPHIFTHAIRYLLSPHLYLWKRKGELPKGFDAPKPPRIPIERASPLSSLLMKLMTTTKPIEARERAPVGGFFSRFREQSLQFQPLRRASGEREVARRVDYR